jgi:hypothetical protein
VIPFVWLGSHWYGAQGALAGYGLGAVVFGLASIVVCFRVIVKIEDRDGGEPDELVVRAPRSRAIGLYQRQGVNAVAVALLEKGECGIKVALELLCNALRARQESPWP